MLIKRDGTKLSSEWYTKPTDTGLTINYNALAPTKYKRSVVSSFVYRIHRSCSPWKRFQDSLEKAKTMLRNNQYPTQFIEPIKSRTSSNIIRNGKNEEGDKNDEKDEVEEKMVFIEYHGKVSDGFESSLKQLKVPCKIICTSKKLKINLPSLNFHWKSVSTVYG